MPLIQWVRNLRAEWLTAQEKHIVFNITCPWFLLSPPGQTFAPLKSTFVLRKVLCTPPPRKEGVSFLCRATPVKENSPTLWDCVESHLGWAGSILMILDRNNLPERDSGSLSPRGGRNSATEEISIACGHGILDIHQVWVWICTSCLYL